MANILEILQERIIIGDGALTTQRSVRSGALRQCLEELSLLRPELISRVHREYVEAGAEVIKTNTFGANRFRLQRHGLENKVVEINRQSVLLARAEAREAAFVAGTIGPLAVRGGGLFPCSAGPNGNFLQPGGIIFTQGRD